MLSLVYVLLVHNFTQIDFKISSQIFIIKDMQLTYHIRMYWNLVFAFKQIIIIKYLRRYFEIDLSEIMY
jgi:hypothetical protein